METSGGGSGDVSHCDIQKDQSYILTNLTDLFRSFTRIDYIMHHYSSIFTNVTNAYTSNKLRTKSMVWPIK